MALSLMKLFSKWHREALEDLRGNRLVRQQHELLTAIV